MKSFKTFRLDTANHSLWRNGDRVPVPPKSFDVLAYLVDRAGQLVTQDEILEALWPETYVNPEVLRKYILEIRRTLGDRPDKPEFIETLPKRGYRFVASVIDESGTNPQNSRPTPAIEDVATTEEPARHETIRSKQGNSSHNRRPWILGVVPVVAVVAAAVIGGHLLVARNGTRPASFNNASIAVLPFADMSPGKDQEYFSDGLSEQIIHNLAKVSGLQVVGRSSAFQFKGRNDDIREVGRKLGVANLLEGSVQRAGNRVRITAELIKADDGFQLWSQTYDRKINDIFAVQDEIARAATEALQIKLMGTNGQGVASTLQSANPEAYEAYLQARYFTGRGTSKEDLDKALAYIDRAIRLDEKYAPAWALRASVQNMMAQYSLIDISEGSRRARDDAERAIALDPNLASAYLGLAKTHISYDWDWDAANTCLTKAAALEPGSSEVFRIHSNLSTALGNLDEAIKFEERAVALDPLRANSHLSLGYLLYAAGRYDEAQGALQKALDLNPQADFAHVSVGRILLAQGNPQQALIEIAKEPSELWKLTGEGLVYSALGRTRDSNAALVALIAKHKNGAAYQIAQVYAYREESDQSFAWLELAYDQRDAGLTVIKIDPLLKNLRHDPRYAELLKKMRLPAY